MSTSIKISQDKFTALAAQAKIMKQLINEACPLSKERDIALQKLESSMLWANSAIARNNDMI